MYMRRSFPCILVVWLTTHASLAGAQGQILAESVATALAGKTVSNLIDEVRLTGTTLISQADSTGNALIARAGNEANVLARNLDIALKEDVNLIFDRLSEERKALVIQAEGLRRDLQRVSDTAYNFKDTVAVDLNSIVTSLPFVKRTFFVQSVRGLSYLPDTGNLRIQVVASTLGVSEDTATSIQVFRGHGLDRAAIPEVSIDQSRQRFTADVSIPANSVAGYFRDSELYLLPITLKFEVKKSRWWWPTPSVTVHEVPIHLSLFPRTAATVTVESRKPAYGWVATSRMKRTADTPDRHCDKKCKGEPTRGPNKIEFAVAGGPAPYKVGWQRMRGAGYGCIGAVCSHWAVTKFEITDDSSRLVFTWDTWSRPSTFEAWADLEEYRVISEETVKMPEQRAHFGRIVEVLLPEDHTFAVVKVMTFTKRSYDVVIGTNDPNGILAYQGKTAAGPGQVRVAYKVNDPAAVANSRLF